MAAWPALLPGLRTPGFSWAPLGNTMAIEPEVGEPMTRRRFTGDLIDVTGTLLLTLAELTEFRNFWRDTLSHGVDRFDWVDPVFGDGVQMIFMRPPAVRSAGGDAFEVDIALRVIG